MTSNKSTMEEPQLPSHPINGTATSRRSNESTNSPEFEFWMFSNPSGPQTNLLTADELFAGGIILPLQQLQMANEPKNQNPQQIESSAAVTESPDPSLPNSNIISSKRWTQIFKKNDNKNSDSSTKTSGDDQGGKERKREKLSTTNVVTTAELNINIWPFSRSRSAGTGGTRQRGAVPARKASSAPCSRSNSTGELKSRKLAHSPSRGAGVHLGRSSPVWTIRRRSESGNRRSGEAGITKNAQIGAVKTPAAPHGGGGGGSKTRLLHLNVPMCIGYQHHLSCSSDENSAIAIAAEPGGVDGGGGKIVGAGFGEGARRSHLPSLRNLFTKKVY